MSIEQLLLVYLRSVPVQRILKWCQSGSNHPRFMEEDLLSIKLPDKLLSKQEKLVQAVRKAISVGRESERLLDIAKHAVEIAIEQNEAAALRRLNQGKP
jgi:restriction endonuclease S subunit